MRLGRRIAALSFVAIVTGAAAACSDEPDAVVPVRAAPPSRHSALVDALTDDARAYAFHDGDWEEDLGDAPFFGLAWLARRAESGSLDADGIARRDAAVARAKTLLEGNLLEGDIQDRVMAALGLIEHVDASGDRSMVPAIDDFVV